MVILMVFVISIYFVVEIWSVLVIEWCEINLSVMEFVMELGIEFDLTIELYLVFE